MKHFGLILDKLTKRIMACPSCYKKIRFPIKLGKTLRVTCPNCHSMFDISFKSKLFSLDQLKLLRQRLKQILLNLKANKKNILALLLILLLGAFIYSSLDTKRELKQAIDSKKESDDQFYKEI